MFALEKKNAAQAVVGCIVWAFRGLKTPRRRKTNAGSDVLHSVRPQLSFLLYEPNRYSMVFYLNVAAELQ